MAGENDPQGYYHVLGLAPNATQAQISHAYREWAKAFHPDVSGTTDAADFHRIKQAYDTLSDPGRRHHYDVLQPDRPLHDATPGPAAADTPPAPAEPIRTTQKAIRCSACNAIPAQPRYCVFYRVISVVAYSRMHCPHGIYCPRCAVIKSVRESAVSWLCGWWSLFGVIQTPVALWRNLCLGEKPRDLNARLLTTQAKYFLSIKDHYLAKACFQQAARFAGGKNAELLIGLGYASGSDNAAPAANEWAVHRHPGLFGHAVPMVVLAGMFALHQLATSAGSRVTGFDPAASAPIRADVASSSPAPAKISRDIRHVAATSATIWVAANGRYVSGGSLPQFTTVEVLGQSSNPEFVTALRPNGQAVMLAASALEPGSGTAAKLQWCNDRVQEPPRNGEVFRIVGSGPNRAVVTNASSDEAVAQFRDAAGSVVAAVFIGDHSQAVIEDLPDGSYRFEFATGRQWNRKCGFFEQRMKTQRLTTVDKFASWEGVEIDRGQHVTVMHSKSASYMIPPAPDWNVRLEPIDQAVFSRD